MKINKQNIEIINIWKKDLKDKFQFKLPESFNMIEKTRVIKKNILETLNTAYELSKLAGEEEIFETSQSQINLKNEIEKIQKDVVSIAVFGQMSSGKSSFLNSLIGEELLTVKQSRATALITKVRHIDNFEMKKDGDIEIVYKTKEEIILRINRALDKLDNYFEDSSFITFTKNNIGDILEVKENILQLIEKSDFKNLTGKFKKEARTDKKELELLLKSLDEVKNFLGKTIYESSIDKDYLIRDENGVFIESVIFYKNIELLKGIELIDTPGLGSNNQLDTKKSEAFIEQVDIIMLLTEAVEPMQKETETDIIYKLEELEKSLEDKNIFDKVFLIVNKIDCSEEDREGIRDLLDESLENVDVQIKDSNILYISSMYEFNKKDGNEDKSTLDYPDNIEENDLEVIEKTIYKFSAEEATSKFLDESIIQTEKIFKNTDDNFSNSIVKLDEKLEDISKKIAEFNVKKLKIKTEATLKVETILRDGHFVWNALAEEKLELLCYEKYENKKWLEKDMKGLKTFKNASKDSTSSIYYKTIGRSYIRNLEYRLNTEMEDSLLEIINTFSKDNLSNSIKVEIEKVQNKYKNDYGIDIDFDSILVDKIELNLSNNINLERGFFKEIKDFLNLFIYGNEDKYIAQTADAWLKHMKESYKKSVKDEIKEKLGNSKLKMSVKVNEAINNIIDTVEAQLNQQQKDKEKSEKDREELRIKKELIQKAFQDLKTEFIDKAKQQKEELFQ